MKKGIIYPIGRITTDVVKDGVSIEEQMRVALKSGEPIQATARIDYSTRSEGVRPDFDIRTDRFEYARMATDKVHASSYAARMAADGFIQTEKGEWVKKPQEPQGEA